VVYSYNAILFHDKKAMSYPIMQRHGGTWTHVIECQKQSEKAAYCMTPII